MLNGRQRSSRGATAALIGIQHSASGISTEQIRIQPRGISQFIVPIAYRCAAVLRRKAKTNTVAASGAHSIFSPSSI